MEDDFGPQIPDQLLDKQIDEDNKLATSYRRPKRFKNPVEEIHPLDEKRILSQVKLKENERREQEIKTYMKSLIKKWSLKFNFLITLNKGCKVANVYC